MIYEILTILEWTFYLSGVVGVIAYYIDFFNDKDSFQSMPFYPVWIWVFFGLEIHKIRF